MYLFGHPWGGGRYRRVNLISLLLTFSGHFFLLTILYPPLLLGQLEVFRNYKNEMWKIKLQKIVGNLLDKLWKLHRLHESPLFTVESTIDLPYQTVMRSCYKPGKIVNENKLRSPDGRRIRKRSFPSEARSAKKKKRQACLFIIC